MLSYYKKHINDILKFNLFRVLFLCTGIFNVVLFWLFKTGNANFGHDFSVNNLFSILDFHLLLIYCIFIIFIIGMDFNNSMSSISLVVSKGRSNAYIISKVITITIYYAICYFLTLINVVYCYKTYIPGEIQRIYPLDKLIMSSLITTIFVVSLSIFFIVLIKDIPKTIIIVITGYFIEEYLWRGKIFQEYGVLAHRYYWQGHSPSLNFKVKAVYIGVSIGLLIFSYFWLGQGKKHV